MNKFTHVWSPPGELIRFEITNEHAAGTVGDGKFDIRLQKHGLGCNATSPKYWYFSISDGHSIAEVRRLKILNSDSRWVADVEGFAMSKGILSGYPYRLLQTR